MPFYIPWQKRLRQWQDAILKKGLKPCYRISLYHFVESDVVKGKKILGRYYPFKVWQLVKEAVPKLTLGGTEPTLDDFVAKEENTVRVTRLKKNTWKRPALKSIENNVVLIPSDEHLRKKSDGMPHKQPKELPACCKHVASVRKCDCEKCNGFTKEI